jgi:hypothetical protein
MKMLVVFALSFAAALRANPPIIVYRPAPSVTVVSPLTTGTAASNQALLNQINNSLAQRQLQHQIVTTNATLPAQPPTVRTR